MPTSKARKNDLKRRAINRVSKQRFILFSCKSCYKQVQLSMTLRLSNPLPRLAHEVFLLG